MAEIDYQLALLLQHQFEQEVKKPKEFKSDLELARTLHEQFKTETEIATPKNGLVYKNTNSSLNSSKCLIDPSWEVIDPTPDVHVLFIAFNQRFFWGKLDAVCVSWGKRMTSCAGICSYQGRGGLCSITLSEPLLKLRPRKDLVETLLHEMIHAYLFVTNNNRDRDGHGPEFCKHMFRINKEAGTHITIYHDFFDEVRLYQQHWWRCSGACQRYVRRAMNRAPGPNDRWWAEHTSTCGGSFVKVKEPEKSVKKGSTKENVKPKEDIRKYGSLTKTKSASTTSAKSTSTASTSNVTRVNNIHTLNNVADAPTTVSKPSSTATTSSVNTIHTLTDNPPNTNVNQRKVPNSTSSKEKKNSGAKKDASNSSVSPSSSSKTTNDTSDYSVVRNHWLNKFSDGNSAVKRKAPQVPPAKVAKLSESNLPSTSSSSEVSECPVCFEPTLLVQLNEHLDRCLKEPKTEDCLMCGKPVPKAEYVNHVTTCVEESCTKPEELKSCSICNTMILASEFDLHAEQCLLKLYDQMGEDYGDVKKSVDCLACGREITRTELDDHLEVCNGLKDVFADDNEPIEGESGSGQE